MEKLHEISEAGIKHIKEALDMGWSCFAYIQEDYKLGVRSIRAFQYEDDASEFVRDRSNFDCNYQLVKGDTIESIEHQITHGKPMDKPFPEVSIEGTPFFVYVPKQEIREKENPYNRISFINQMFYHDSHYEMYYNPDRKNIAYGDNRIKVIVPQMADLDRAGLEKYFELPEGGLKGKNDFQIFVDQELYEQRRKGVLPTVMIGEDKFVINLNVKELQLYSRDNPIGNGKDILALIDLIPIDINGNKELEFFYNADTKTVFDFRENVMAFPPNTYLVQIPDYFGLDPYFQAKLHGLDVESFLMKYPFKRDMKATLQPAESTRLQDLVNKNRQRFHKEDGNSNDNKPQRRK